MIIPYWYCKQSYRKGEYNTKVHASRTRQLQTSQHPASSLHLELSIFDAFIFCFHLLLLPGQFTGQINNATIPGTSVEKDYIFQLKWMWKINSWGILKSCLDPGSPTESARWLQHSQSMVNLPNGWHDIHIKLGLGLQMCWKRDVKSTQLQNAYCRTHDINIRLYVYVYIYIYKYIYK